MPAERDGFGTLGDPFGDDLKTLAAASTRVPLPSYDLPSERRVVTVEEVLRTLLHSEGRDATPSASHVTGVFASATALVASKIAQSGHPVLVVVAEADEAIATARDIAFFLGPRAPRALTLMPSDASPYADVNPDRRAAQLRLATLSHLARAYLGRRWSCR